jgi:hypothetical protein
MKIAVACGDVKFDEARSRGVGVRLADLLHPFHLIAVVDDLLHRKGHPAQKGDDQQATKEDDEQFHAREQLLWRTRRVLTRRGGPGYLLPGFVPSAGRTGSERMPERKIINHPCAVHFVTFSTYQRRKFLSPERTRAIVLHN